MSYLLIYGELPNLDEFNAWRTQIMRHTYLHNNLTTLMKSFNYDAHVRLVSFTDLTHPVRAAHGHVY